MILFYLPIKTISEANSTPFSRGLAFERARRVREQKESAFFKTRGVLSVLRPFDFKALVEAGGPIAIRLTRLARITRPIDDDNLPNAMKAVRDGLAKALGFDDGNKKAYKWEYAQETCEPLHYAVKVEIFVEREYKGRFQQFFDVFAYAKKLQPKKRKTK